MQLSRFKMRQRITMMVNRYEFYELDEAGQETRLFGFAEQKRLAFKEQVTIYSDASRGHVVCGFKARSVIDFGAGYDVLDGAGQPIGEFKKDFSKSILRSTWHLGAAGINATGQERNQAVAVLRRVWDVLPIVGEIPIPFLFHFDFRDSAGDLVMSSSKKVSLRDSYLIELPTTASGKHLDHRVAMAMAVALDALQAR